MTGVWAVMIGMAVVLVIGIVFLAYGLGLRQWPFASWDD